MATAKAKEISLKDAGKNLTEQLKSLGLNKSQHDKGVKSYQALKGSKRMKADRNHWLNIGSVVDSIKNTLSDKKVNLNSGLFGAYCKVYYPLLQSQDLSNAKWFFLNQFEVKIWADKENCKAAHPAAIKMAISKSLKANDADDKEFKKYGLNPPGSGSGGRAGKSKKENAAKDGDKIITAKNIAKMKNPEKLAWIKVLVNKIDLVQLDATDRTEINSIVSTLNEYLRVDKIKQNTKRQQAASASN